MKIKNNSPGQKIILDSLVKSPQRIKNVFKISDINLLMDNKVATYKNTIFFSTTASIP